MVSEENYIDNLRDAKEILDNLQIKFWIDGGTLLGAYRDRKVIAGDEDDIDLITWCSNKVYLARMIHAFKQKGFEVFRLRETIVCFKRNNSKIDIFFCDFTEDHYYLTMYLKGKPFALAVPKKYFDYLGEIEYYGMKFNCPEDIEGYLELCYGNWREPVGRDKYKNYEQGRCNFELTEEMKQAWEGIEDKEALERTGPPMPKIENIEIDRDYFICAICKKRHTTGEIVGERHLLFLNANKERIEKDMAQKEAEIQRIFREFGVDKKLLRVEGDRFLCPQCQEWHKIKSKSGQLCLEKINTE